MRTMELFIGGPVDGQSLLADVCLPYWTVRLDTEQPFFPVFEGKAEGTLTLVTTARYRRLKIGHRVVFVHDFMSDERAIDRLLMQYFPPSDPN